jgi:hypothetical protein
VFVKPELLITKNGYKATWNAIEYGAWFATTGFAYLVGNLFCVRFAPRHALEKLIWFGLALQLGGSLLNLTWSIAGFNLPKVPVYTYRTKSGLILYTPQKGDQCWDIHLTCVPYPDSQLRLIAPGDLSKGFAISK